MTAMSAKSEIVNDLLKVARVDSGKMRLERVSIDIVPLIQDVLDEQASKFRNANQKLHFVHSKSAVIASIDTALIRMALENLVDNAHKYTYPDRNINITAKKLRRGVQISVQDEGTGIAASDIDKLFHKFSRLDNPLSVAAGGSGIGLYWVKRVIDLHNGSIEVDSKVGKGTTFTIILPE